MFGAEAMTRLKAAKVAVFGIGGVGGYAVEALARSGIGSIHLFDYDQIELSNINRQLHATHATIGEDKVLAAAKRISLINPDAAISCHKLYYLPETADEIDLSQYDYIIDAMDTVTAKIELAVRAASLGVWLISSMGAGNKVEAAKLELADIYETSVCPLAKVIRRELRKRGVKALKVVYSKEEAITPKLLSPDSRHQPIGSNAFVPATAGLIMAGEVVKHITSFPASSPSSDLGNPDNPQ